jgi:formate dehydrogenase major subunit
VCPTGALIDRQSAYRGKEVQVDHHETVCVGCSLGCGLDVMTRDNNLMRIEGNWKSEINKGLTCKVGRFYPVSEEHERLTTPLVKKDGKLKAATWEEAMSTVAAQLKPLAGKSSDGIAAIASTRLTAEALHLFKELFVNGLKSDMVTSTEEGACSSAVSALAAEYKKPFEGSIALLKEADCVLVLGEDPAAYHEVASFYIKRNQPSGTKLIVVDSDKNTLTPISDLNVLYKSGKEIDLLNGLIAAAKSFAGSGDTSKISGFAQNAGTKEENIIAVVKMILSSSKPVIIYGKETESNLGNLKALMELAKLLGVVKDGYSGMVSLKGNANSFAAAQLGLDQAFKTNGHKAVFVALGDDTPTQRLIQSLSKKSFLVVQASYVSPLTAVADVVLPVHIWTEEEGHFINSDGKVQKAIKSLEGHVDVKSNEDVLQTVAKQVGVKVNGDGWKDALHKKTPAVIMQEM